MLKNVYSVLVIACLLTSRNAFPNQVPSNPERTLFNPSLKYLLSYHNGDISIALAYEKKGLAIDIENTSQPPHRVQLPSEIVQVNQIAQGPKGKAIILGMVNGSVFEVVIVDLRSELVADQFLAYSPSVSPDGRFVAFVKFYPLHFVDGTDDHYLLYDVIKSPTENRSSGTPPTDHTNVGTQIFPSGNNLSGDNIGINTLQQHHMAAQAFFWRYDSNQYVFLDLQGGKFRLIGVSTSQPQGVFGIEISKQEMCKSVRSQDCEISLFDVQFSQTGILADLRGVGTYSSLRQSVQFRNEDLVPVIANQKR